MSRRSIQHTSYFVGLLMEIKMTAPSVDKFADETYLTKKYALSRQQARRLLLSLGHDKAELERWLGCNGRTQIHRPQDMEQTRSDLIFG